MILKIFAVYDAAIGAYMAPHFLHSRGQALRAFLDMASDPNSQIGKHSADFTLFELGEYDDSNGSFSCALPVPLGNALELLPKS